MNEEDLDYLEELEEERNEELAREYDYELEDIVQQIIKESL